MGTLVPQEPIKLGFDPSKASKMIVRQVFSDDIARALWMMVKSSHIVDESFDKWCLETALAIRSKLPTSLEELHHIIRPAPPFLPTSLRFLSNNWEDSKEWLQRLETAISGANPIQYITP